ncbi:hypothetical protein LTR15_010715 [Elasticomyces elasticus]|nr:hypothetical protein LTR15_010715 [Elasticomyces elasticus]
MNIFESSLPQEGQRATETAHRKIELQSPADLTYLIANVARAAREKLDKHLPPDAAPEGEDAMRKRVEELVDDILAEIEPFDTKLAQRLQSLSAQIEHQTLQLANMRRTRPAETAQHFQKKLAESIEKDNIKLSEAEKEKIESAKGTSIDPGHIERVDEMQSTWQNGSEELVALKSGLGGTVARLEKAQVAVDVVQEKK